MLLLNLVNPVLLKMGFSALLRTLDCSECCVLFHRGKLITFLLGESPAMYLHQRCGRNLFCSVFHTHNELQRLDCKDFILIISSEMGGERITHKAPSSCMRIVHNLEGWVLVGSLCRRGRSSFPQLLDIRGPSQTLKEQPQGIAPIQKISVCAAILWLQRNRLCPVIAAVRFWGVSEWGRGAHQHSPYFWDSILESRQALPHSLIWPCRFQVSMAQGHGWHRWGCAHWHYPSLLPEQHVVFSSQEESFLTSLPFLSLTWDQSLTLCAGGARESFLGYSFVYL